MYALIVNPQYASRKPGEIQETNLLWTKVCDMDDVSFEVQERGWYVDDDGVLNYREDVEVPLGRTAEGWLISKTPQGVTAVQRCN